MIHIYIYINNNNNNNTNNNDNDNDNNNVSYYMILHYMSMYYSIILHDDIV